MMFKFRNADFLMAKRSKRGHNRQNKDRAGCMSGIISVFDFRHGRINRRLLSDNITHMTESVMGPSYPTSEVNSLTDSEDMHLQIESLNCENFETTQTRVKELMEEEMQGDHVEKPSSRSFGSHEVSINQEVSSEKTPQYRDLEDLMNELLVIHQKRNEEQKPKSLERSNSLENSNERGNQRSDEPVIRKHRNFFRRRSKSHECISLNENDSPLPSNKTNELHNERSVSQFSFTEIKKKLKNAIGRSPRDLECREKPVVDGYNVWSSPNRDHFHSERFSRYSNRFKSQDEVSGLCKSERKRENVEFGDTSDRISNIYVEAKKHLSEMISNGDEDTEFMVQRHSRTLGKLLSIPDYDSLSSGTPPKNEPEHAVINMSCENLPMVNESQLLVTDDEHQEPEVSYAVHPTEGIMQIEKRPSSPENNEVFDESDLTEDDELSCSPVASPSGSLPRKTKEVESISDDKTCKPSPVSVLEPLFSDDDISPARTVSRSGAEASIQPLRIRFEETVIPVENQETCIRNHVESEESAFEYVEAVLLASDLNWDEFEKRWLSSIQILDPSLYDELRIFSSRPGDDQRFLFDSTNEILKEICDHSLGDLAFGKTNIRPLPMGMNLINEVWGRIESRLDGPYLQSLDQLIKKDLEVSRMWIDLRLETGEIVVEMEESILEDMIDDTISSIVHD